jgi:dihydrofolate reductase
MMAGFWPSSQALSNQPVVAARMNATPKIVFSRTLAHADWNNTELKNPADLAAEMRGLKARPGEGMVILGSGMLVAQLAQAGLVDEFQVVVNPLALGGGRSLFAGANGPLPMQLLESRAFRNGKVLLRYAPAG